MKCTHAVKISVQQHTPLVKINNKLYELRLVDLTYHFVIGQL